MSINVSMLIIEARWQISDC